MSSAAASRFQAAGAAAALSVATAQRQNDMRRMQASRESAGPVTPRAARPPAPAPPVEVSATELEELKLALQSSTDMLKKSEEQLRTERKARSDIEAKLDDLWMIEQGHRARAPPKVMDEVAQQLETSGHAPWFRARASQDGGLGLQGAELRRYEAGVASKVHAIVVKETDSIAGQLDRMLAESIRDATDRLRDQLRDSIVPKIVSEEAVRLHAVVKQGEEESKRLHGEQLQQVQQNFRESMDEKAGVLEKELQASLEQHTQRMDLAVAAQVEDVVETEGRKFATEVRFLTEILDDFRQFVDEIWLF